MRRAFLGLLLSCSASALAQGSPPPDGLVLQARVGAGGGQIVSAPGIDQHGGMIFEAGLATLLRLRSLEVGLGFDGTGLSPLSDISGAALGLYGTAGVNICRHGPALGAHFELGMHHYSDVRYVPGFHDPHVSERSIGSAWLPYAGLQLDLGSGGKTHGAFGFFVRVDLAHAETEGGRLGGIMAGLAVRFGGMPIEIR